MNSPASSPANKDPATRPLRRGDLVRVSEVGVLKAKRFKDRQDALGRILHINEITDQRGTSVSYDVEWILGGRLSNCDREDLVYTTAEQEGMTDTSNTRRNKRKPTNFMQEVLVQDKAKKLKKQQQQQKSADKKAAEVAAAKKIKAAAAAAAEAKKKAETCKKKAETSKKKAASKKSAPVKKKAPPKGSNDGGGGGKKAKKRKLVAEPAAAPAPEQPASHSFSMYERHRREFERVFTRLGEKVDCFHHFWDEAPPEFVETYGVDTTKTSDVNTESNREGGETTATTNVPVEQATNRKAETPCLSTYPAHAPYNWEMIRRRMENGRYVLDRRKKEEDERFEVLAPYYATLEKKRPQRKKHGAKSTSMKTADLRVLHPEGVHWELLRDDIFAMCNAALARMSPEDKEEDDGQRGSLSYAVKKVKESIQQAVERTGARHAAEMDFADDRHKFALAVEKSNTEAAMQSWRKEPFPERKYERLASDVVCAGLSEVDEKIANYELRTSLPDSFIGLSYRYDDTGQSEAWMKSVVDETGPSKTKSKKKNAADKKADEEREALLALSVDEGVTRAQVTATMQSLLIAVQDKVMTEANVLRQPELRSANWIADSDNAERKEAGSSTEAAEEKMLEKDSDQTLSSELPPEIVEHPVWGIDCYTRRNIQNCLQIEFDSKTVLLFIEKWLLPAINSCPDDLGHNISNAARILEGLPFEDSNAEEGSQETQGNDGKQSTEAWSRTLLGRALIEKIQTAGPPWLQAVSNQLRRAHKALGPNFFRVHPKGHGSVVLSPSLKPNTLVTFYRGELYPSWRWGEKMDAIEITQKRKDLKPALPDFYNMALERPQGDPRGYGLLFVDASRKAGHGSSLSHSCAPTCEVRVAAHEGELCLAMTTLRELEMGEELTFDYNAVTESLNEYRSAVCLCGYGKCRGSFLHFATADCYQQVLNRNSPIATRFASLVKGSMKRVMSQEDDQVLRNHGFLTASFGAISVNRRELEKDEQSNQLVDSLDMVPIWLRTYVADTLRYIEYERRALPIALICDHISSAKETKSKALALPSQPLKEPKLENTFFYFTRTETDFLMDLLRKEGTPDSLKGLQLRHTLQKVASGYWNALTDDKKQFWKDKARADYEKKLEAWQADKKKQETAAKKEKKSKTKPGINDILHSSKMSFQDADAEGVAAMEQRIQQLTQSLSRVGRVLDRHREGCLESVSQSNRDADCSPESMRKRAHSPLKVLTDEEVVQWMWNSNDGIVALLLKSVERSRCVRPQLLQRLRSIREKHAALEHFGETSRATVDSSSADSASTVDGRSQLTEALLEMRASILSELAEMSKEFKSFRQEQADENRSHASSQAMSIEEDNDEENDHSALCSVPETTASDPVDDTKPVEATDTSDDSETAKSIISSLLDNLISEVVDNSAMVKGPALTQELESLEAKGEQLNKSVTEATEKEPMSLESSPWLEFYGQRFTLHAAADLLLLYAHTSNFFSLEQYRTLESTPVEVYARELGNAVPRSVIDEGDAATVAVGVTPVAEIGALPLSQDSQEPVICNQSKGFASPADFKRDQSECEDLCAQNLQQKSARGQSKRGVSSPRNQSELCAPDDIVAKVSVRYQGDYVLAQLLQWYNAGIGQKPGLPDLVGCTILPNMSDCWASELMKTSKLKADRKTTYETKIRPRLVEWLQDPFQRGNPWPQEIRRAFVGDKNGIQRDSTTYHPFGSPIIDFLVSGDESNITSVLSELDADDKIAAKKSAHGLLKSVDSGRPAQAVSTWVQCENPECMKWRKIPWHVDADLLPEKFYCKDNVWNAAANSCDVPGDDWDEADALVDSDGKVEGSPVKKKDEQTLSVHDESSFRIGTRFDVKRSDKKEFSIAKVVKADFSGSVKRIMFHFNKTSSERDEWVEFGSPRIAPLHSKVTRKKSKACVKTTAQTSENKQAPTATSSTAVDAPVDTSKAKAKKKKSKSIPVADPSDIRSFTVGARFDVLRQGKDRYYHGTVKYFDFSGPVKKIMFHFPKTSDKFDEWIEFGSPRICAFDSKVSIIRKEKQAKKKEKELMRQRLALEAASANKSSEFAKTNQEVTDMPVRQVSAEGDGPTETAPQQIDVASDAQVSGVEALKSLRHYGLQRISGEMKIEGETASSSNVANTEVYSNMNGHADRSVWYETDQSRRHDSVEHCQPMMTSSSGDSAAAHRDGNSLTSYGFSGGMEPVASAPSRPPDFVTAGPETASVVNVPVSSNTFLSPQTSRMLSGLDMLAAVTNQHMFNAMPSMTPGPVNNFSHQQQSSFLPQPQNRAPQDLAELIQRQRARLQELDPSGFLSGGQQTTTNQTEHPSSNQYRRW